MSGVTTIGSRLWQPPAVVPPWVPGCLVGYAPVHPCCCSSLRRAPLTLRP
ncbi:MAG: hypothetical protein AAGJ82_05005 [Bacteroidota bacterium]